MNEQAKSILSILTVSELKALLSLAENGEFTSSNIEKLFCEWQIERRTNNEQNRNNIKRHG